MPGDRPREDLPLVIRRFAAQDIAPANALTNYYISHTAVHFGTVTVRDEEFFAAWQSGAAAYPWLTAERHGAFVGYAKAYQWRSREAYRRTAEVGIYIDRAFQGMGIGPRLYQALIDHCRSAGFHTLVAGIALPNDPSIRLHEACGFSRVGTFREVGHKLGQWHDVGFWQLLLDDRTQKV